MKLDLCRLYVCPLTHTPLELLVDQQDGDEVLVGRLASAVSGLSFPVADGVPDFTHPSKLPPSDQAAKDWYDANADVYDEFLPLTFKTFGEDETAVRQDLVDRLHLQPHHKVLEVGAGTGRDSIVIAQQLSALGELHLQDLAWSVLSHSRAKLEGFDVPVSYHVGNAAFLPYPDHYFDAVFHFGGLNTFADIQRFLAECVRVTKPGGRIVVGDESMPAWLRETEFGRILMNSNPHYRYELPLQHMPVQARKVKLEWIIGGVFYVIEFDVGQGVPEADFDFEIPGPRGGSHRTRYYGHLEGVSEATRQLAQRARAQSGKSMHGWLEEVIAEAARRELGQEGKQ
ncbi:methyltransferase domain-containing protein [Roseateles toxinivorans]|uniref:Ubiquinone/menaquinone biosynthesis C-methylase UbiE n=1 Tax=Roseateles toxinivorans TaxID=270368 RepID=A0A4R6QNA8_9BURK|nr:methyltransferase domain-containing protein [Roseateles toxinivorans]TDP71392.1 ubiquinone/menaquinone biosynthesis C-methylase UbiE [Roseateles toxinivorans]